MKEELISVIVPVYNVEIYLKDCVQSVLNQRYSNFELILVDDCSTDCSGAICDEYAGKDSRIKVIHKKKNEGLSAARNTGVGLAGGSYICFVDSDDYVWPDYLSVLYENAVLCNADVSWCSFVKFTDILPEYSRGKDLPSQETIVNQHKNLPTQSQEEKPDQNTFSQVSKETLYEYLSATSVNCKKPEFVVAWNKLIRRELALKLEFPKGRWHEDEFYINDLVEKAEIVVETSACLYGYRQRNNSITGNDNKMDFRHLDVLDAAEERIFICRRQGRRLYNRSLKAYRWAIISQFRNFSMGIPAAKLKCRFLASFIKYPDGSIRGIKGWILFLIYSKKFYEKYWR